MKLEKFLSKNEKSIFDKKLEFESQFLGENFQTEFRCSDQILKKINKILKMYSKPEFESQFLGENFQTEFRCSDQISKNIKKIRKIYSKPEFESQFLL